ncbi:MAG TPA: hypothetical protein VF602_07730 [Pedobacter sp.]|jgi:DNA-binding ferritin-like protein (Dps family)
MRAIEHGIKVFGGCSYSNRTENIYVFNESMVIKDDENPTVPAVMEHFYEVEKDGEIYRKIDNGNTLDYFEVDYLKSTKVGTYAELQDSQVEVGTNTLQTIVYKLGTKYFVKSLDLMEDVEVMDRNTKTAIVKTPLMLVNDVLKEKQMAVVLFISTDGAKITRAYQEVTELYYNEIVLFIEVNDKNNYFGSVVKVRTGANISNLGIFPYRNISKLASIFKSNVDESSLREILTDYVKNKDSERIYLVKKIVLGLLDKVVIYTSKLSMESIKVVAETIAGGLGALVLADEKWRYYDDEGIPVEKPQLLLPGIELFKKLKNSEVVSKGVPANNITASALEKLKNLKAILLARVNEQTGQEGGFFLKSKTFEKLIRQVINAIDYFIEFIKNPLKKGVNLLEIGFVAYNALVVGIINGLIEAIKGIFDLIAILSNAILDIQKAAANVAANIGSYIILFIEIVENQIEVLLNIFSKENIKAFFKFIEECLPLLISIPSILFKSASSISFSIDEIAYYTGYIIGMIIQIIIEILATGGAATVERAAAVLLQSFKKIFENIFKLAGKAAAKSAKIFDAILDILSSLKQQSKNLKPLLDDILESLRVLLGAIPKDLIAFFNKFDVVIKKVPQGKPLYGGLPVHVGDDIYALVKEGKELFRGTKKEVEELAERLKKMSDKEARNYIDKIKSRRNALTKWSSKFEKKFHLHFDGELKLKSEKGILELKGTGGHNHSVIGDNIRVRRELTEPVDDLPFDALIDVRYKQMQWIEKTAKSSMFPKNWNIQRVKEEIALVYEKTVGAGKQLKWANNKFNFPDSSGRFEILIEVDNLGNITNAYPFRIIQ